MQGLKTLKIYVSGIIRTTGMTLKCTITLKIKVFYSLMKNYLLRYLLSRYFCKCCLLIIIILKRRCVPSANCKILEGETEFEIFGDGTGILDPRQSCKYSKLSKTYNVHIKSFSWWITLCERRNMLSCREHWKTTKLLRRFGTRVRIHQIDSIIQDLTYNFVLIDVSPRKLVLKKIIWTLGKLIFYLNCPRNLFVLTHLMFVV